jgi:cytochrome c oxidase assembly factor CtaG
MPFVLLHASTEGSVLAAWSFEPFVTVPLLLAGLAYYWGLRGDRARVGLSRWRVAAFYSGLSAAALALVGPPGVWNDELFFLHMIQHLLLMMVAAPLLLLGRPIQLLFRAVPASQSGRVLRPILKHGWVRITLELVTFPAFVLVIYNANLVLWHLPPLYGLALDHWLAHELEHVTFISTALLLWWVLIDPVPRHHRASLHWLFGISFTNCVVGNLIAAALTLSPRVIYSHYQQADTPWGLSPLTDQHIGGMIMWLGGSAYFVLMFVALYRMVQPSISQQNRTTADASIG